MKIPNLALALVALCPFAACADNTIPTPSKSSFTLSEVRFETNPGKPTQYARPGEPGERIVARRSDGKFVLTASRNLGTAFEQGSAALTESEWQSLEALIKEHKLTTWKPHPKEGNVNDYSYTAFAIRASDGKSLNQQEWSTPLDDEVPPYAVSFALGKLAAQKIKTPKLFYFGG